MVQLQLKCFAVVLLACLLACSAGASLNPRKNRRVRFDLTEPSAVDEAEIDWSSMVAEVGSSVDGNEDIDWFENDLNWSHNGYDVEREDSKSTSSGSPSGSSLPSPSRLAFRWNTVEEEDQDPYTTALTEYSRIREQKEKDREEAKKEAKDNDSSDDDSGNRSLREYRLALAEYHRLRHQNESKKK